MNYIGIDIGSTATKAVILDKEKNNVLHRKLMPSGWNSKETGKEIYQWISALGYERKDVKITATGYGRISVDYSDRTITEITCHAKGAYFLNPEDMTVIDIGGQDTKIILVKKAKVNDFIMNNKCSAGTGRFLEIMANQLGLSLAEMFALAQKGKNVNISSICTVFAESEIISLMGKGTPREDIARGIVESITKKVATLATRKQTVDNYFLTGGFCDSPFLIKLLAEKLNCPVKTHPDARYAGAIGAAVLAK